MGHHKLAAEIITDARHMAMDSKGDTVGTIGWARGFVPTIHSDLVFVEAVVLDWDVIYTLGPFIGQTGITSSTQVFTSNVREAAEWLAAEIQE